MTYGAGLVLLAGGIVVAVLATLQVLQYRRGAQLISGSQLALRLLNGLIILAIIVAIFVGELKFSSAAQVRGRELFFGLYWSLLVVALLVVVILALVDYRLVLRTRHRARADLYLQMADLHEIVAQQRRSREERDRAARQDTDE
jgi:hypothetical protein